MRERLLIAFELAVWRFVSEHPRMPATDDLLGASPGTTLLAAVLEANQLHAAWIGPDFAAVLRSGDAIRVSTPHTLFEEFKQTHPQATGHLDPALRGVSV